MEEMKSRVRYRRENYEPRSVAWMNALRKFNKTKKVYDINPYAEVYQFRDNVYGILTDNLDGGYCSWMFLVVGPEKAMLIDTSWGLGDLKGLADQHSGGRPLIVVNTHEHMDHAYGNCQFDRVYCHEYCAPYLKMQNPHMRDYIFDENGKGKWVEFDPEDLNPYREFEVIGCPNHYIFDLGSGYEIELIWLPGHSVGGAGYLDKKNRILFCGDAMISMRVGIARPKNARPGGPAWLQKSNGKIVERPYGEYGTVTAFRNELEKLVRRLDEFDYIFPGHFILDIESYVVEGMLEACNEIVADPSNCSYEAKTNSGITAKYKYVKGMGTICYADWTV